MLFFIKKLFKLLMFVLKIIGHKIHYENGNTNYEKNRHTRRRAIR